nr:hypothetical protein [Chthoniobacterales bacterium]
MVALIAALNGWIICWGAIDWFGALAAFAWFPWVWWAFEKALDGRRGCWRFLWPAPFVYLLVAGGFPYTIIMMALLAAWLAVRSFIETRKFSALLPIIGGVILGVGLSAPAWLALFDYVHGSARQAQPSSAHWQWLVPPTALPAFILPGWTVKWADFSTRMMPHSATEMACGLVAPAGLIFGLFREGRSLVRRIRWELALLALVLTISMLPSANVFRWSFRWLPFLHLILALCAAEAMRETRKVAVGAFVLAATTGAAMWILGTAGRFGLQLCASMLVIAAAWALLEMLPSRFTRLQRWMPAVVTLVSLLATYLCVPPNGGVPRYNLDPKLTRTPPLDPQRLYLSIYPPPELAFRAEEKGEPFGTIVRPGSASMWGGVRFVNGYSPIRPAGVAREFDFAIHGEIADWMAPYLLDWQSGPEGELARIGVDGIIVSAELELVPKPEEEWVLDVWTDEGRVYHRRGGPLPVVRAMPWLEPEFANSEALATSRAEHEKSATRIEFAAAKLAIHNDSRHSIVTDVEVPPGDRPALLAFSRPFFRGYRASLDGQGLRVGSYRGLLPTVEVPAGSRGRLTLLFRPWWLVWGGAISALCLLVWIGAAIFSRRQYYPANTRTG